MSKKAILFIILSSLIIGGIGGWIFERFLIPKINAIPFLVKYNLAPQSAPLVINRKEEIRVNEGSDSIAAIQKVQPWMVGILSGADFAHAQITGGGVVLTSDGLIAVAKNSLTNLKDNSLTLVFNDGTVNQATLVAQDPASDLALVKVNKNNLATASLGRPSELQLGQRIIVLNPTLTEFEPQDNVSFLSSTVKNLVDKVYAAEQVNIPFKVDGLKDVMDGSMVISLDDNVQGFYSNSEVVTADTIRSAMNSYFANGKIVRNQFGFSYSAVSVSMANAFGLSQGIQVRKVVAGSSAAKAGLQDGDVITAIEGAKLNTDNSFQSVIQKYKNGDVVKLSVARNQQPVNLNLTIVAK